MGKKPSLNPLRIIKTTKDDFKDLKDGEYNQDRPVSPSSRLLHEPGCDVHIIAIVGMKSVINVELLKSNMDQFERKNFRFSCIQVLNKENGSMTWVPTKMNLDYHIVVPDLDPKMESSEKFVEDYISNLSKTRLEMSEPLWDMHILNTCTSNAQSTCICRFHHSVGDGMSLMNYLLGCSLKASDHETLPALHGDNESRYGRPHIKISSFRSLLIILWNSIVALVAFMLTAFVMKDTKTPLKGSQGIENTPRRFVHRTFKLEDIKLVKRSMSLTINDVVLGVVQAALYRYLDRRYDGNENRNNVPENIRLRATLFFNLRAFTKINAFDDTTDHGKWGNKIGYALLPLKIKRRKDPLDHVRDAHAIMEQKKASLEPLFTSFLAKLVIKWFGVKIAGKLNYKVLSNTTLIYANVPGPQDEILLFGHEVAYIASSCYGQPMALMIHAVSYVDKLTFMISVDEEIIPDPEKLCDDIQESLHDIKSSVLGSTSLQNVFLY